MKSRYKIIKNWKGIKRVVKYCKDTGYSSFDFETTGHPFHHPDGSITGVSISFQIGSAYFIPLDHPDSPFIDEFVKVLKYLGKHIFQNPLITKIAWNIQFEDRWLLRYGIRLRGICLDGMLAKYTLDEEKPMGLKPNVAKFLPEFADYDLPGTPSSKAKREVIINFWSNVELKPLAKYCCLDSDLTFRLMVFFERRIIDKGFYKIFRNLSMQIAQVLAESTYMGMQVDKKYLKKLEKRYGKKIEAVDKKLENHKIVRRFEKAAQKKAIRDLIKSVKKEIEQIEEDDKPNAQRLITAREEKISRYIVGAFTTKKELQKIQPVNFGSPAQMVELLFKSKKGFRFDIVSYTKHKFTKKDTDTPSTGEDVLKELARDDDSGFMKNLLKSRELKKLHSTYMVGMLETLSSKNKVHTNYLVAGTVTGRLSSRSPNMQNIPRPTTNPDVKKMFVPPKGFLILEVDYSQAELRVVAELARDKTMINMFKREYNIHCATAAMAYTDMSYEQFYPLTKDEGHKKHEWAKKLKKKAKTYNFGVLYGQSPKKLAETIADATGEKANIRNAEKGLAQWFKLFSSVDRWIKKQQRSAKKNGYVTNLFGRKRRLPDIHSSNYGKMLEAQRQSVNAPIQGAASDFTQFSSVLIREERLKGNLPDYMTQIYTVHDSIGFYIKPKDMPWVIPRLIEICANPQTKKWFNFQMKYVNMKVSPEIGINWASLKDYDRDEDYSKLARN